MARSKTEKFPTVTEDGIISTVFGKETAFDGYLEFKRPLQINGSFKGEINTKGVLLIGNGAEVTANIKAGTVIVGGLVKGNIEASKRLEMLENGKVIGNIKTAKLQIADGVVFDGNCEMIPGSESSPDSKS
ncbi:MAG: polymer-forming cytoskeletal protein [Leptospiraceae bacterium]|nr:polymer-forming cytoskeletal protein [Leptospiraceae bacterium]